MTPCPNNIISDNLQVIITFVRTILSLEMRSAKPNNASKQVVKARNLDTRQRHTVRASLSSSRTGAHIASGAEGWAVNLLGMHKTRVFWVERKGEG